MKRPARRAGGVSGNKQALAFQVGLEKTVIDYARSRPFASFRLIVSPLVSWIWIGGIIVFAGGLIALWPAPAVVRRRAAAAARTGAAREPARA